MARRLLLVLLGLAAALTVALAAAVIWRVPIAQALIDLAIADLAIPDARARVVRVAGDGLRAVDLAAGERPEFTAGGVEIAFRLPGILRGELDRVAVDGPTVKLNLRPGAAPFGSLQPLFDRADTGGRSGETGAPAMPLPDVELRGGHVVAETPFGPASLALDGTLASDRDGGPALDLRGRLESDWARLTAELSANGDPMAAAEAHLAVSDGAVDLPDDLVRIGTLAGDLNLRVEDGRPMSGRGALEAGGLSVAGTPFDRARARFALSRDEAELTARLGSDDGSFALDLDGRADALDAAPHLRLDLRSEIGEAAPLWALARPPFPTGGSGHVEVAAAGDFPAPPPVSADLAGLQNWLAAGALAGTVSGQFSRLSLPGFAAEADVSVDLDAAWADGALRLATRREIRASARGLAATDLAALGLPTTVAETLAQLADGIVTLSLPAPSQPPAVLAWPRDDPSGVLSFDGSARIAAGPLVATLLGEAELTLAPALAHADLRDIALAASDFEFRGQSIEELQLTGRVTGAPEAFEAAGELHGRLGAAGLNGVTTEDLSLDLPFRVSRDGEAVQITLPRTGRFAASGLRVPGGLTAAGPVEIALAGGDATVTLPGETGSLAGTFAARLGLGPTDLLWQGADGARVPIQVQVPRLEIAGERDADGPIRARATVREAAVTLPEAALAFEGMSADLELPEQPDRAALDFEIAAVRHTASPAAVAPLRVAGQAARRGDAVELTAAAFRRDGARLADASVRHDLAAGTGSADIVLLPLSFQPGSLQPAALSPALATLSDVRGNAEASATLTWDRGSLAGTADVAVQDFSFTRDDTEVTSLDLDLRLDSLQPPASPPHQHLSAALVDTGVPLKDLEVRFRLLPDEPGRVLIEDASFTTVGSRVSLHDTLIDPTGERLDTRLQVAQLDIGVLFDVLAVDGLSGSGELAGTIPVRREGGRVIIENARLTAGGPGVLRFRSDAAAQALAGGGEHVELAMKALEDFHYETLTLTGNLDPNGEASLLLEVLGNNPDVLDGYPFQLNISLSGNSTPILQVLQQSRAFLKGILQRVRRYTP